MAKWFFCLLNKTETVVSFKFSTLKCCHKKFQNACIKSEKKWHLYVLQISFCTCPSSSNAMTTTAAPYCLIFLAFSTKSSSPSFMLILLTIHFPWVHFSPASITAKLEESIHRGTWLKFLKISISIKELITGIKYEKPIF